MTNFTKNEWRATIHFLHEGKAAAEASKSLTLLPHPLYSPDLASSSFNLFGPMKDPLRGIGFTGMREIKRVMKGPQTGTRKNDLSRG